MADRKGRKDPVQTISSFVRPGKMEVTPLRPQNMQTAQQPVSTPSQKTKMPTHDQIAERAWAIWIKGGCLPGQDRHNWLEAERQLKAELGIR